MSRAFFGQAQSPFHAANPWQKFCNNASRGLPLVGRSSTTNFIVAFQFPPQGEGHRKKLDAANVIGWLGFTFGARGAEQGQSWLSKTDESNADGSELGNTASTPWGSSLLPNEKVAWIDKGVVKNMYYDRFWAQKAGKQPNSFPSNLVLEGQNHSLADLIASVDRGLLVTRLWYIRMVQPKTGQLTGLTRDGVFLVEKGKVTDAVNNFRWNESPAEVLQRTTKLTQPIRVNNDETGSNMAPALITTDFNCTSISDAV